MEGTSGAVFHFWCEECTEGCRSCRERETCLTCEPDGVVAAPGGVCPGLPCPQHCTACSEPGLCDSCTTGHQPSLDRTHCVRSNSTCRPGEMMKGGRCEPCDDKESCTSCPPGFLLNNFSCVTSCPQGWYNDAGWCRECTLDGCVECFGPNDCLNCAKELKLFGGQCMASCPQHTFQNTLGTCSRCHHFCNDCSGEGPYSCLSCSAGRYLDAAAKLCMPCQPCNMTNQHQCCQCDPNTGLCHLPAGKRRISVGPDDMMADSSQLSESLARFPSESGANPGSLVHNLSSITTVAMGACAALLVSSGIIFIFIQVSGLSTIIEFFILLKKSIIITEEV